MMDALNAWRLVGELSDVTGLPAAASFKHVSPAGVGLGIALTPDLYQVYDLPNDKTFSLVCTAYIRARNTDPMSSYGDFVALSNECDEDTATFLKSEVSDGIIAPSFSEMALKILKTKKKGKYCIIEMDPLYQPPENIPEIRDVFGLHLIQLRSKSKINEKLIVSGLLHTEVTPTVPEHSITDMILATITAKYTQSNSVVYAKDGQTLGVGAGQQNRVDCVKLAGKKAQIWFLRNHPKALALKFKSELKRQEKVNARVRYIEGDYTSAEMGSLSKIYDSIPEPLTLEEKTHFMKQLSNVTLSSDGFFPFRDSIDHASKYGVKYVVHPGGSACDLDVLLAAQEYDMIMCLTGLRLFHH